MLKSVLGLMAIGCLFVAGNDDLTGIKCVVNGEAGAKKEAAAKYLDGEVYFCWGGCKSKFEAAPEKYTVKANHQLANQSLTAMRPCVNGGSDCFMWVNITTTFGTTTVSKKTTIASDKVSIKMG